MDLRNFALIVSSSVTNRRPGARARQESLPTPAHCLPKRVLFLRRSPHKRCCSYNCGVAKLRPARGHKKQQKTATRGRLIGCLVILAGLMFLFYLLLARLFRAG